MKNYICPECWAQFPEDQCNTRPFAPLDCGVLVECPQCQHSFESKPIVFSSAWPKLNKQDAIGAYVDQLQRGEFHECRAEIAEVVCLTVDEWDHFKDNLLENHAWLAGKGGNAGPSVRRVVLVVRPGETPAESLGIFVDPQGFDYARYVGFYITDKTPRKVTNVPNLPTLSQVMNTQLCGRTYSDRVLNNILFDAQAASAA